MAKIVSAVFHPIFMTLFGVFIIFNSGIYETLIPVQYSRFVYEMILLYNILMPLTMVAILILFKRIKNKWMEERWERILPLIFGLICSYACYIMVSKLSPAKLINLFLGSAVILLTCVLLITFLWKISMHMAGIGGITGLVVFLMHFYNADMFLFLCIVILITGIISASRLVMGSHSISELLAGYFLGIVIVFGFLLKTVTS